MLETSCFDSQGRAHCGTINNIEKYLATFQLVSNMAMFAVLISEVSSSYKEIFLSWPEIFQANNLLLLHYQDPNKFAMTEHNHS